jgi:DNA-directed RNA polymerase specialized sigma24 family protein
MLTTVQVGIGDDAVDEELIKAAMAGDERAGAFMISLYGPKLLGYCRTIAPDLGDVDRELICEQAVETACRKIDDYDSGKGTLHAWLRGFVRYGVWAWRRGPDSQVGPLAVEPEAGVLLPAAEAGPARGDPRAGRLVAAVRALPPHHQLLIALRFTENLPTHEIASRLGISDAAVRQRLSRLARQLRTQVESQGDLGAA